ncbi:hypothetical protein OCF52_26605 [Bacillus cereus]|nr:hypothetical protein [Bacillus cereus]
MTNPTSKDRAYWTHEISEKLQISNSTLKRWANELEMSGYKFTKGANESCAYTNHDLLASEKYNRLIKIQKEEAASIVTKKFIVGAPDHQENELILTSSQVSQTLEIFMQQLQEQEITNRKILQELKSANELNKTLLLQYDQLKQDFDQMRESQIPNQYASYFQRIHILDSTIFQVPNHLAPIYPDSGGCAQTAGIKKHLKTYTIETKNKNTSLLVLYIQNSVFIFGDSLFFPYYYKQCCNSLEV